MASNELVLVSSRSDVRDSKHDGHDELAVELEAMSTIGRTLEAIEDPSLRQRILNWAVQRWGADRSSSEPIEAPRATAARRTSDCSDLSVDSIAEFFDDGPAAGSGPQVVSPKPAGKAPVESMLQSLAADFQRLADEWNGA